MLDEEPDEPLVRSQRRAMDAQGSLLGIVAVLIGEPEALWDGKVHLVGRQGEFPADDAPDLHVDFRAVKGRLIRHLNIVYA